MKPYIRDIVYFGAQTAGTATIDIKAGDLIIGVHSQYGTSNRMNSTYNLGVALGGDFTNKWTVSGTSQSTSVWVLEAASDFTATIGPDVSYRSGNYGITQCVMALRGVKYLANYYLNAANPDRTGPLAVSQSGRPYNWTSPASNTSAIAASNFQLDEEVGVLSIGAWPYLVNTTFGQGGNWVPDSGETLSVWDDTANSRHTCIAVAWHEPSAIQSKIEAGEILLSSNPCFYADLTGNDTGAPTTAMGVSFAVVPEEYTPDDGGDTDTFQTLTMGDGTPVTLEGYWDGTQLLPAEFVGLATA